MSALFEVHSFVNNFLTVKVPACLLSVTMVRLLSTYSSIFHPFLHHLTILSLQHSMFALLRHVWDHQHDVLNLELKMKRPKLNKFLLILTAQEQVFIPALTVKTTTTTAAEGLRTVETVTSEPVDCVTCMNNTACQLPFTIKTCVLPDLEKDVGGFLQLWQWKLLLQVWSILLVGLEYPGCTTEGRISPS